jgi:hypothetical protein
MDFTFRKFSDPEGNEIIINAATVRCVRDASPGKARIYFDADHWTVVDCTPGEVFAILESDRKTLEEHST